jgi:polyhydroxyalkanoate synthesis regulator phasin
VRTDASQRPTSLVHPVRFGSFLSTGTAGTGAACPSGPFALHPYAALPPLDPFFGAVAADLLRRLRTQALTIEKLSSALQQAHQHPPRQPQFQSPQRLARGAPAAPPPLSEVVAWAEGGAARGGVQAAAAAAPMHVCSPVFEWTVPLDPVAVRSGAFSGAQSPWTSVLDGAAAGDADADSASDGASDGASVASTAQSGGRRAASTVSLAGLRLGRSPLFNPAEAGRAAVQALWRGLHTQQWHAQQQHPHVAAGGMQGGGQYSSTVPPEAYRSPSAAASAFLDMQNKLNYTVDGGRTPASTSGSGRPNAAFASGRRLMSTPPEAALANALEAPAVAPRQPGADMNSLAPFPLMIVGIEPLFAHDARGGRAPASSSPAQEHNVRHASLNMVGVSSGRPCCGMLRPGLILTHVDGKALASLSYPAAVETLRQAIVRNGTLSTEEGSTNHITLTFFYHPLAQVQRERDVLARKCLQQQGLVDSLVGALHLSLSKARSTREHLEAALRKVAPALQTEQERNARLSQELRVAEEALQAAATTRTELEKKARINMTRPALLLASLATRKKTDPTPKQSFTESTPQSASRDRGASSAAADIVIERSASPAPMQQQEAVDLELAFHQFDEASRLVEYASEKESNVSASTALKSTAKILQLLTAVMLTLSKEAIANKTSVGSGKTFDALFPTAQPSTKPGVVSPAQEKILGEASTRLLSHLAKLSTVSAEVREHASQLSFLFDRKDKKTQFSSPTPPVTAQEPAVPKLFGKGAAAAFMAEKQAKPIPINPPYPRVASMDSSESSDLLAKMMVATFQRNAAVTLADSYKHRWEQAVASVEEAMRVTDEKINKPFALLRQELQNSSTELQEEYAALAKRHVFLSAHMKEKEYELDNLRKRIKDLETQQSPREARSVDEQPSVHEFEERPTVSDTGQSNPTTVGEDIPATPPPPEKPFKRSGSTRTGDIPLVPPVAPVSSILKQARSLMTNESEEVIWGTFRKRSVYNGKRTGWKDRHVVLKHGVLAYFAKEGDKNPKNEVYLKDIISARAVESSNKSQLRIEIDLPGERKLQLFPKGQTDFQQWLEIFVAVAAVNNGT